MNKIIVRHFGIPLEITRQHDRRFVIPDYSTGERVRHIRTNEREAREKAKRNRETWPKVQAQERGFWAMMTSNPMPGAPWKFSSPPASGSAGQPKQWPTAVNWITVDEIVAAARYWRRPPSRS